MAATSLLANLMQGWLIHKGRGLLDQMLGRMLLHVHRWIRRIVFNLFLNSLTWNESVVIVPSFDS